MTVDVRDIEKRYGESFRLYIPDLAIGEGEYFGLVGNNGAGKTTLLRLVLDLLAPDGGAVYVDGQDVARSGAWRRATGAYVDESFLLGFLTVREYLTYCALAKGIGRREVERAIDPLRVFLGEALLEDRSKYIRDLSAGSAARAGIAAALLGRPQLLVLDEPFAYLDPGSQIVLKYLLAEMNRAYGTTMILSSHDLEHVTDLCGTIGVLENGAMARQTVTTEGTLQELQGYFTARAGVDI